MKKRLGLLLVLLAAVVILLMPAAKINIHSSVDAESAAVFGQQFSLMDVLLKGAGALPVSSVPQMGMVQLAQLPLCIGMAALALAALIGLLNRRGALQAAVGLGMLACAMLFSFATQFNNAADSLLYGYLLTAQFWVYVPAVLALLLAGYCSLLLRSQVKEATAGREWQANEAASDVILPLDQKKWRKIGAVLAVASALCIFLPYIVVSVPATVTEAVPAGVLNRTVSMMDYMLDNETTLNAEVVAAGASTDVLNGDLGVLNAYSGQSASNNNIKYIFQNPKAVTAKNAMLLAAVVLLILGAVLALIPSADRWFAVCCHAGALIAMAGAVVGMNYVGADDFYAKAGRQLVYLGLGSVTFVPMLMLLLAGAALLCGVMGVRRANEPYFVNPVPEKIRIRVIAILLAVLALATVFLPAASFSFYKAGGSNVVSTEEIGGIDALTFSVPDDVAHPKDKKGKLMYEAQPKKDEVLTDTAVESVMGSIALANSVCTWLTLSLTVFGIAVLMLQKAQKLAVISFGAGFLVRAVQWLLITVQMSSAIGESGGTLYLYLSMPLLVFAAFFSGFVHLDQIPKKYRLFLMMLPFLVSVFLFSYLPLAGWRYAFYNYKFGLPWSQQEFVGFKWFTEMFTNSGHFTNIVRVMKNTLGMSLLGLAFSWLPMFFAIFLNEINNVRFKKFVQIFTTLPNFISWALVFSFAMTMFSMETGIFSKFMLAIGAIDQPVAWLNSGEHIWLKMWAWGTWKGLGWSSIMYLAAIAGIDQEMYEAARVDGANRWNVIRHITLPSLLPTFFVLLLLSISNIINNGMDQYLVFQNPMNKTTIEVLDLYVYNITIASKGTTMYSFGTAIGILKTIVSVTLLFTANFTSKKLRGESIL